MRIARNNAGYSEFQVIYGNYYPREVDSVWATRKEAEDKIEELCKDQPDADWRVEELIRHTTIPYQKCPVCDGTGLVSRPPNIAGDVGTFSSSHITYECRICDGKGIIKEGKS